LDAFMAEANAAYYATHDPFADFTTSPEISQVFGELLGAWAAIVWAQMRMPPQVLLVEAGPGRGSLMQDALRCITRVAPRFAQAIEVHFVETSPRLRQEQALRVPHARWHDSLDEVPNGIMILLANEFLDSLPIRQFVRRPSGWRERFVVQESFVELDAVPPGIEAPQGEVVEIAEAACAWVGFVAKRIALAGGAALIVDYGKIITGPGDTLQALRDGRPAEPLRDPGCSDITAHVDFAALARAARTAGATVWGPIEQGEFLNRLGLRERTESLSASNPAQADRLREAAERLASPDQMGSLFKAMCLTDPVLPAPPGFV
jgi:SAM-dependent MidA family methyltransferase